MRCDIMNKGPGNTNAGFENEGDYEARNQPSMTNFGVAVFKMAR